MRLFFTVILGMALFSCRGLAQEDNVTTATSALQDVLSSLKQSVEKLSLDNDQLNDRDNAIKAQISQLQMELGRTVAQGDSLNNAVEKLRDENPRGEQQISRLEAENIDLDNQIKNAQDGIKSIRQSLDAGYQEDQKLLLQLKGMGQLGGVPPEIEGDGTLQKDAAYLQKEKLKLMKMIYDSQQRQLALHASIIKFQKNTPVLPGASALAHQELLKERIKDLETQVAAYPPQKPSPLESANQWDNAQLYQLEQELKDLEKNYSQLKDLTEKMSKKTQTARMTVSQKIEEDKLQGNINDLNRQGVGLRADLDDLRSQMVDLDKRKSHLESMIQQLP